MGNEMEKRCEPRHRTFKRGMIVFNGRYSSSECTIKNESTRGAMLAVGDNHIIPSQFEVRRYPEPEYRPAQVRWRTDTAIGILYQDLDEEAIKPLIPDVSDDDIMKEMEAAPEQHHRRRMDRRKGDRRSGDRRSENRRDEDSTG